MNALQFYNSLTRQKEAFIPREPGKIGMYVCGMTVYDYCHIGHARVMVVFDTIARHLRASGYALKYVRNITDIDDKIIARANENGEPIDALTARFIDAMHEDEAALGCQRPDVEPRATAAVTGGTAGHGGSGTVWGVMARPVSRGGINNGLSLLNVSPYWQMVVKGGIIVIAIIIDERKNR